MPKKLPKEVWLSWSTDEEPFLEAFDSLDEAVRADTQPWVGQYALVRTGDGIVQGTVNWHKPKKMATRRGRSA